jgi:DnaJ-class molecular chaperone
MKPVSFFTACPRCGGHGRIARFPDGPRSELCPACRGKGIVPTAEGRDIMGLLKAAGMGELMPDEGI